MMLSNLSSPFQQQQFGDIRPRIARCTESCAPTTATTTTTTTTARSYEKEEVHNPQKANQSLPDPKGESEQEKIKTGVFNRTNFSSLKKEIKADGSWKRIKILPDEKKQGYSIGPSFFHHWQRNTDRNWEITYQL